MRRMTKYIMAALLLSILTAVGCGKPVPADSYVEGTDFQYQYFCRDAYSNTIVQGKDGLYFMTGSYIYQFDEGTGTIAPLCNKPNCLHDKEMDGNRAANCNAYIERMGIAYMDGSIYFIEDEFVKGGIGSVLYKAAGDGSAKEKVYQWEGDNVEGWCLHRDALYYVEHIFDEDNVEHYTVKAIKLTGMGKLKPEAVWQSDEAEDLTVYALGIPQAYGNHLYFTVNGTTAEDLEDMQTEEGVLKYSYTKTFQYNLQDKTLTEIRIPGQSDTQQVSDVTFWQDKIVYRAFDLKSNHEYDTIEDVYIADMDGSNAEILLKDMPMYRWYTSDGTYLYVSNCAECLDKIYHSDEFHENKNNLSNMKWDYKLQVDVYNKDMELVDSLEVPYHGIPQEPVYGIGERMYVNTQDDSGVYLEYWDKTKLGTYQGDEYELVEVGKITDVSEEE